MAASALICWYLEKTYSVQTLGTIVEPKKRYGEFYKNGDVVKAKFHGVSYPALVVKIDDDREELIAEGKKMEKLLSNHSGDILPEEIIFMELKINDHLQFQSQQLLTDKLLMKARTSQQIETPSDDEGNTRQRPPALPTMDLTVDVNTESNRKRKLDQKIKDLEAEMRDLKNSVKSLKRKVAALQESAKSNAVDGPQQSPLQVQNATDDQNFEQLLAAVSHLPGKSSETTCLRILALRVFSQQELLTCSRTGKKTSNTGENPKPRLELSKLRLLERAFLSKFPELNVSNFNRKFDNILKIERRSQTASPSVTRQ